MANFCPNCGRAVKETAKFCPGCGQKLEEESKEEPKGKKVEKNEKKNVKISGSKILCIILAITMLAQLAYAGFKHPGFLVKHPETEQVRPQDDAIAELESPFHSDPVDFSPIDGVRVTAEKDNLFEDTKITVTEIKEDERVEALVKELLEDNNYAIAAWEVDAGIDDDISLPGEYQVSIDLSKLDVPEDLYPALQVMRLSDNNEISIYESEVNGNTITYTSSKNSITLLTASLAIVIGVPAVMAGVYAGIEKVSKEWYFSWNGCSYNGSNKWGTYTVRWNMADISPEQAEIAKRMEEIVESMRQKATEDYEIEAAKVAKDYGSLYAYFHTNLSVAERMKNLAKEDEEFKKLAKQVEVPKRVQTIIDYIDIAYEYICDYESIRTPKKNLEYQIRKGDKADNQGGHNSGVFVKEYIELMVKNPEDLDEEIKRDNMLLTITHETFHACQERYHTTYWTDSNRFDEMVTLVLESDAKEYYIEHDIIHTDPELTNAKYGNTLATSIDSFSPSHKYLQCQGYFLSKLIQYLRKETGKYCSPCTLMLARSYRLTPNTSEPLMKAFKLTEDEFDKLFRKFCLEERNNIYASYEEERGIDYFKEYQFPQIYLEANKGTHISYQNADSYSIVLRQLVIPEKKLTSLLIVMDSMAAEDNLGINMVPLLTYFTGKEYKTTPDGVFLPAPKRYLNSGDKQRQRYLLEVYGSKKLRTTSGSGYTVWPVTACDKPVLSQENKTLKIELPKPVGAAEAGLIDGLRITITKESGEVQYETVKKDQLGTTISIPFSELMKEDQKSLKVKVKLEEFVLSKKQEEVYMPESEEVELILGDNDLWVMTEHVFENEPLEEGYDPIDHMFYSYDYVFDEGGMTFIEYCDGKEIFRRRIQHPPKVARTEDFEAWYGTFRDERGLFCGLETKELKNRGLDGTFAESLARCGNPDQFALHINYNGYVYRKVTPSEAVNVTVQEVITDNLYDYIHNGEWFQ